MALLTFVLFAGVIKEDFLVDQSTAKGFQICASVAALPDGGFAVAWQDSVSYYDGKISNYIKFFDKDGNARTSPLKLNQDSVAHMPVLSTDKSGHTVCVWSEYPTDSFGYGADLCAMVFDSTGAPLTDCLLLVKDSVWLDYAVANYPDGFMVFSLIWNAFNAQRYDYSGTPVGERLELSGYLGFDIITLITAAMNSQGTVAVSYWYCNQNTAFIMFNVLDSANNKAFHDFGTVTDDTLVIGKRQSRPRVRWVDDERFAIFWEKTPQNADTLEGFQGKLFNAQGDSLSPIKTFLSSDTNIYLWLGKTSEVSTCHGGKFALAYGRRFRKPEPYGSYHRAWGFLLDTTLRRTTEIFRIPDTDIDYNLEEQRPSVDASDDRIIWVWEDQSQMREIPGDTFDRYYTDLHCKITDWDVGIGVGESPRITQPSNWQLASAIGSRIVLRYWDRPEGFRASVYDASGRRVDEIGSNQTSGTITWGECYGPGVYFIKDLSGSSVHKVVLVK